MVFSPFSIDSIIDPLSLSYLIAHKQKIRNQYFINDKNGLLAISKGSNTLIFYLSIVYLTILIENPPKKRALASPKLKKTG